MAVSQVYWAMLLCLLGQRQCRGVEEVSGAPAGPPAPELGAGGSDRERPLPQTGLHAGEWEDGLELGWGSDGRRKRSKKNAECNLTMLQALWKRMGGDTFETSNPQPRAGPYKWAPLEKVFS